MNVADAVSAAGRTQAGPVRAPSPALETPALGAPALRHRLFDLSIALVVLPLLLPLMLAVAFLVSAQDRGPIVFAHLRVGRGGRMFRCWKFRSMVVDAEARLQQVLDTSPAAREEWDRDHKLRDDPRITRLGRFLRSSSLDELPQFYNVLVGEMSIVGPRPIVRAEISRYGRRFDDYCRVRPGITGLWQVSGRNDTSYRRRVAIDSHYARGKSVVGDIAILARTVPAVLARKGSY